MYDNRREESEGYMTLEHIWSIEALAASRFIFAETRPQRRLQLEKAIGYSLLFPT